ncbi:hypothetical protein NDU88_002185 [Pleurodeles waltl]|uniref:Uncharacterized protein n=1 Tax=Pleurodeles waltl TaxID=8319 RepID=A0AAV7MLW6_PLEWA|nr:hypothetical protein NDU88_002185 [Pleurodeles waltl]
MVDRLRCWVAPIPKEFSGTRPRCLVVDGGLVQITVGKCSRRRRKSPPPPAERMVVHPDGFLELESSRLEREEARALVESATCAGSLDEVTDRQTGPLRSKMEADQRSVINTDSSE